MNVAVVQLPAGADPEANGERAESRIRAAAADGADLVVLPEMWPVGYFAFDAYREAAESVPGPTTDRLAALADELSVHLHGGSLVERDEDGGGNEGDLYNTSVLFGPDGTLLDTYRKIHLFGYDSEESDLLTPGERPCAVETELGTIGLTTCYDLRFPELYRSLVDSGVEMLLVTSAWPRERIDHWHLFARTRAVENQAFLLAANLTGSIRGVELGGESVVVDPWGIERANAGTEAGSAHANVGLDEVRETRESFPALADRRL
ncbi:carbon-nitrogen family hydrolase [Halobellus limi]|uniref:Carbon-nitrogen family hydrolase n=1 Tax=Halobellus limi TaxID=699433 RepID=A0A1H6CM61_9EURY|nr:carbon-nitrogen family hydrolase [Halobellus limi]QCC48738.1 carbon-nitrogen family hydrolase [Halobellus limi]SEG74042.1 Carbon-nitrogen hydrolase [Halobellus limi]